MTAHERANLVLAFAKSLFANGQATEQMVDAAKRLGRALGLRLRSFRAGANCNLWATAKMARSRSNQWPLLRA
jgi:hypothetical protein